MEGTSVMPVYDMNGGNMGGNNCWVWFILLLLLGGNGFGWGRGSNELNQVNNDFLYTNLKNTMDSGFMQTANQNFGIQKDLCQGFNSVNQGIAQLGYNTQNCCCETNRNIDAVRYENAQNTCAITTAIHAEGEATRALINANVMQDLRDRLADRDRDLQAANFQLSQLSQTSNIVGTLRPFPIPAYITCSPYQANNCYGNGACNGCC